MVGAGALADGARLKSLAFDKRVRAGDDAIKERRDERGEPVLSRAHRLRFFLEVESATRAEAPEFLQPAAHVTYRLPSVALLVFRQRGTHADQSGVECRQQTPVELGADPFHDLPVVGEHSPHRRHLDSGKGAREPGRRQGMPIPMVVELCHLLVHPTHSDRAYHAYRGHEGDHEQRDHSEAAPDREPGHCQWSAASIAPIIRAA